MWWLLWACAGAPVDTPAVVPQALVDCPSAECASDWVDAHWGEPAAIEQISGHPDPVVQLFLLQHLVETRPAEVEALCQSFPANSEPQKRCRKLAGRPHLWDQPVSTAASAGRSCDDKLPALVPEVPLPDPWEQVAPAPLTCPATSTQAGCHTERAISLARDQDLQGASAACVGIDNDQWRYECAFQVMESAWMRGKHGNPGRAAQACLAAGPYLPCCLGHLAKEVGLGAPAADELAPKRWTMLLRQAQELRQTVSRVDPDLGERLEQQTLSIATTQAFDSSQTLAADLVDQLPGWTAPAVRAGAAYALLRAEGRANDQRSGEEWVLRLDEVLRLRARRKGGHRNRGPLRKLPHQWSWKAGTPAGWSHTPSFDGDRRVLGVDADADRWIALLEAGAVLRIELPELARNAAEHPDPRVRWTAARLAEAHGALGLRRKLAEDTNDNVRAVVLDENRR